MGDPVTYSDIPTGFQTQQAGFGDIPAGFALHPDSPAPDLFDREWSDLSNRANQIDQAGQAYRASNKSMGRAAADIAGAYGGGISDTVLNGLGSIGRAIRAGQPTTNDMGGSTNLTDLVKSGVQSVGNFAMQPSQGMVPSPGDLLRFTQKQIGPDATAVAGDALNVLGAIPGAKLLASTGEAALPVLAKTALAPAKYVGEGIGTRVKGLGADSIDQLNSNIDNNYTQASDTINEAHNEGAILTPEAGQSIIGQIKDTLAANRFNPAKHVDTAADLADITAKADAGNLTLQQIDDFRKSLGDTIKDNTTKLDGANADAFQAVQAKNALLDGVSNLDESAFVQGSPDVVAKLRTGINQYAQAARYEKVANIAKNADGNNAVFTRGIKNFVKNDNNLKGFNPDEIAALKDIPSNGIGGTIENWLGKFGIDANRAVGPMAMSLAKTGAAPFIPGGIPLVGAGTIARATSKLATKGGYQNALDTIMGRDITPQQLSQLPASQAAKIMNMRNRVNVANNLPNTLPDRLALPAPEVVYKGNNPSFRTNEEAATAQDLNNLGLTSDVLKAQESNLVNKAWEDKANQEAILKDSQLSQLYEQSAPQIQQMLQNNVSKITNKDLYQLLNRRIIN